MENVQTPRPMTHDLMKNILEDLEAKVERIVVCSLRDNTFYATIHLASSGGTRTIDARPSDAIALALRTQAPIYVEDDVIREARSLDHMSEGLDKRLEKWLENLSDEDLGKYKM
jgi:bifunctional DNase/RNase